MKRIVFFGLVTLSIQSAQAGSVCRTTCSGVVVNVIDGTFRRDAGFEKRCKELGGTVKSGGRADLYGYDDMGCRLPDSFILFEKESSYCVIEEHVQATGFGITAISTSQGGWFTASDSAYKSCHKNLSRSGCHGTDSAIEASDVVTDTANCNELPD